MTNTVLYEDALPPEIWSQVLENIPQLWLPNVQLVCSLFHAIITPILFTSIKIYFFGGRRTLKLFNSYAMSQETKEISTRLSCRSQEILNRICQDPQFARVVKSMTVIAFADASQMLGNLISAVSSMPRLRTFRWIGDGPRLDDNVADNLPNNLEKLVVQSPIFPLNSLRHLQALKTLHLAIPFSDCEYDHLDTSNADLYRGGLSSMPIQGIFRALSLIQSLRICATHIKDVPVQLYTALRKIEIFATFHNETELRGLDNLLLCATSLESLSITGLLDPAFTSLLPCYASTNALPKLKNLRLSTNVNNFGDEYFQGLFDFLQGRSLLRRLYICFQRMNFQHTTQLFTLIKDFRGLDVLGLHTGERYIVPEDTETLMTIVDNLPLNLRALHLVIHWEGTNMPIFLDGIKKLRHLRYFHVVGLAHPLRIQMEELAAELTGLDTIGFNRILWSVQRTGADVLMDRWPRWKSNLCLEQDFSRADDAWLFKDSFIH